MKTTAIRRRKPSEEGYMLVTVMFILAILMISLTVAAPVIKKDIQRDREVELMHRGMQYKRAVKLYYKQFGGYPRNVDALIKTNNVRFLRKKYIDLTTEKTNGRLSSWASKRRRPWASSASRWARPAGWEPVELQEPHLLRRAAVRAQPDLAAPAAAAPCLVPAALGASSTSPGSEFGSSTVPGSGAPGSATDPTGASGSTPGTGLSGQTFGGAPIIGFSPNGEKESILVYRLKNHYNEWEFLYNPIEDQAQGGNLGAIGQPMGGTGTGAGFNLTLPGANGTGGANGSSGSGIGGSGFGGSGSGGSGSGSGNPLNPPASPPTQ